jgi:hypothetical protein
MKRGKRKKRGGDAKQKEKEKDPYLSISTLYKIECVYIHRQFLKRKIPEIK